MGLNAIIDLLLNSAQFDSALDKSEKRIKGFAREAEKAGKIAGKIGTGLSVANVAGLDKLAQSSKMANAAIQGLTGAMLLLGAVPLPIAIGVAAVGALAAFALHGNDAAAAAEKLEVEIRRLGNTAQENQIADLGAKAAQAAALQAEAANRIAAARRLMAEDELGDNSGLEKSISKAEADLKRWQQNEKVILEQIKQLRQEASQAGIDGLRQMAESMEQSALKTNESAEAAAWFAIQHGKLGEALASSDPKAVAYAATIMRLARAQDASAAAAKRQKDEEKLVAESMRASEEAARKLEQVQRETTDLILDALPEMEREYARFQERLKKSALSPEDQKEMTDQWVANWAAAHDKMSIAADQAARNMQSAFADFLFDPFRDGLDGLLKNFLQVIQRMIAEAAAARIFDALGFGGKTNPLSGALNSLFGGARASGGPVSAGKAYLVGENGPELFAPGASGAIIPNAAGGSVNITQNLTLNGGSAEILPQVVALLAASNAEIKRDLRRYMSRGV